MNILAIDPGPEESAFIDLSNGKIVTGRKVPNDELLADVQSYRECGHELVIEMIASYGMPVGREVFETCVWIGRFIQAFDKSARCHRLTRIEIKSHLCHSAKAKDGNIRQALIDRIGPQGTKRAPGPTYGVSGDVWSALAVAVTWMDKSSVAE